MSATSSAAICAFARALELTPATTPVNRQRVVVLIEGEALAHLVGRDHVEVLALEFGERIALDVLGFRCEPDDERSRGAGGHRGEDVRRSAEREHERVARLLDLLRRHLQRPVVGDRRGRDEDVGAAEILVDRGKHLLGRLDVDPADARRRTDVDRAADQYHLGAGVARRFRDRKSHLSGAAVGDESHRVDAFARGPRGDDDLAAGAVRRSSRRRSITAAASTSGSSMRPGPVSPQAWSPSAGPITSIPRAASNATLACVAAFAHISRFIAGATVIGTSVARHSVVSRS